MLPLSKAKITADQENVNPLRAAYGLLKNAHWREKEVRGQGENTLKLALACIMEYIKVGKERRY